MTAEERKQIRDHKRVVRARVSKFTGIALAAILVSYIGKSIYDEHTKLHEFDDSLNKFTVEDQVESKIDDAVDTLTEDEINEIINNSEVTVEKETQTENTIDYEFPETYDVPKADDTKSYELLDAGYTDLVLDWEGIKNEYGNDDIVAWVNIPGTKVNYPIVQGPDNDYYLHRDLAGNNSDYGSLFQDSRDTSLDHSMTELKAFNYTYGHHMRNGGMYAAVDNYQKQSYFDEHQFGILYTPEGTYKIDFYAAIIMDRADVENVYKYDFTDEDLYNAWIEYLKENSLFKSNVDVEFGDVSFVMQSCNYTGNDKVLQLFGKLTKQMTYDDRMNNEDEGKSLTLSN